MKRHHTHCAVRFPRSPDPTSRFLEPPKGPPGNRGFRMRRLSFYDLFLRRGK